MTALLILLIAAAAAAPAPTSPLQASLWTPASSDQSTCGRPSFQMDGPDPAADWRHCAALLSSWSGRNGTFVIHDNSDGNGGNDGDQKWYIPLLKTKGCVLGVRAAEKEKGGLFYTVGDRDLEGIMSTALKEYSAGTEVKVGGEVECVVEGGGSAGLRWQIYGDGQ